MVIDRVFGDRDSQSKGPEMGGCAVPPGNWRKEGCVAGRRAGGADEIAWGQEAKGEGRGRAEIRMNPACPELIPLTSVCPTPPPPGYRLLKEKGARVSLHEWVSKVICFLACVWSISNPSGMPTHLDVSLPLSPLTGMASYPNEGSISWEQDRFHFSFFLLFCRHYQK